MGFIDDNLRRKFLEATEGKNTSFGFSQPFYKDKMVFEKPLLLWIDEFDEFLNAPKTIRDSFFNTLRTLKQEKELCW